MVTDSMYNVLVKVDCPCFLPNLYLAFSICRLMSSISERFVGRQDQTSSCVQSLKVGTTTNSEVQFFGWSTVGSPSQWCDVQHHPRFHLYFTPISLIEKLKDTKYRISSKLFWARSPVLANLKVLGFIKSSPKPRHSSWMKTYCCFFFSYTPPYRDPRRLIKDFWNNFQVLIKGK